MIDVCVTALTLAQYNKLKPRSQGYATYMQAEWPDSVIPKTNPYPAATANHTLWNDGADAACRDAEDMGG